MHTLVAATARPTADVIGHVSGAQLDAPTPCSEFDVRALLEHLSYWGPSLVGAASKQLVAEQGREMGVYGAPVLVAPDAPLLDRVLGLTGRDPRWTA
ncbi:maleylpyruvate isomerase N-terminal domain-containing protein [Cryptosporangium sp. NPDC051539]|uniref:maleylpyruvate isomerase N-terminal domain-containing protein n=1 Tax=Cryptosporangium sp. NPDC051539 TaxID=3363962 RepID=UPI0037A24813